MSTSPPTSNRPTLQLVYSAAQEQMFFQDAALGRYRFYPKGRRLGATRGAANACIEWCLDGMAVLWGDTTHANIGRYVDRYFKPTLKRMLREHGIPWSWNQQKGLLVIGDNNGYVDFRSSDRPENWEGFGYHRIFLNEAGIILNDRYLFENAVLPMLMDFADGQLIAAGTPKLRQGKGRLFAELWQRCVDKVPGYFGRRFTSFDNPFITRDAVLELCRELGTAESKQEVYGLFVEPEGTRLKREWLRFGSPFPRWEREQITIAVGVDLAIKKTTQADYTAAVVVARCPEGYTYVLDAARTKVPFHQILLFINAMAEKWGADIVSIEETQFQAAVVQEMLRLTTHNVRGERPDADKITRFQAVEARYERGLILHASYLPGEFQDELLAFPMGDHDDFVDALGLAFRAAASTEVGQTLTGTGDRVAAQKGVIHDDDDGFGTVSVRSHSGY